MSEIKTLNGHSLADTKAREDIATLTEDVTALSEEIEKFGKDTVDLGYDNSKTPMWTKNGYIDATNGSFVETGAGAATDYIDISEAAGGNLKASVFTYDNYGMAFYDIGKNYISGIDGNDTGNTKLELAQISVTIPENAYYMRLCGIRNAPNSIPYEYPRDFAISLTALASASQMVLSEVEKKYGSLIAEEAEILPIVLNDKYVDTTTGENVSTASWCCTDYIRLKEATIRKVTVRVCFYNNAGVAFFDAHGKLLGGVNGNTEGYTSSLDAVTAILDIPDGACYMRASLLRDKYTDPSSFGVKLYGVSTAAKIALDDMYSATANRAYNVLVLGDSYSAMGYWLEGLRSGLNIAEIVNLGVVSATIRDHNTDRATYPYTNRPTSSGTNNQNTVASQVQKLKRLMAGTDLDAGESSVYVDTTPDVIIIEGGMNDEPDTEEEQNAYGEAFIVKAENVYYKDSAGSVKQGTYYIKPDVETVDRTTFAGAYRYIVEELLTLFPNAQIFITTASRFNYFTTNPQKYDVIAKQQIECARYCSASVIDWNGEGNLNTIVNCPRRSGTESDPYTVYGGTKDTTDGLHPNLRGGRVYGRLAAKVIRERFVGIGG